MANLVIALIFSIFFFVMYMKANVGLAKASDEDLKSVWAFIRILMLFFLMYFFGSFLWMAAFLAA